MNDRTLISGGCVVTVDDAIGVLPTGDVLIEDGRIAAVADGIEAGDARRIDAAGKIVMPGFVDNHRHTWQTPLRGLLGNGTQRDYLLAVRLQMAALFQPEDNYVGNYVGALEALDNGVTTIVDYSHNAETPEHAVRALDGLRDAGIRAVWAMGYLPGRQAIESVYALAQAGPSPFGPPTFSPDQRDAFAHEIAGERFSSREQLLTLGIAPAEMALVEPEEIWRAYRLAGELEALLTHHTNPAWFPPGDITRLGEQGVLDAETLLVHCTLNTASEWEIIGRTRSHLCVCAESEMQMAMGPPATARMRSLGLAPSLGVDTVSSNGGDLFAQMRLALQTERHADNLEAIEFTETEGMAGLPPQTVSATTEEALRWATLAGAEGAGLGHVTGSLTPGKRADVVILDPGLQLSGWDAERATNSIVLQATPRNVETVLVDGQVVKEDGRLNHVDIGVAERAMADSKATLLEAAQAHGGYFAEVDLPI